MRGRFYGQRVKRDGTVERTFWIQGRTGRYWQNLESLENDQTAIMRLGALISEDRYDELRLIQAQVSAITGETDYTNIVTIRDGQVIDSPMLRAQAAADGTLADAGLSEAVDAAGEETEPDPEHHPQLRFWPTPKPENMQGRLGLSGEQQWADDGSGTAPDGSGFEGTAASEPAEPANGPALPKPKRRTAKFVPHVTVHSGPIDKDILAGGWRIPRDASAQGAAPTAAPPPEGEDAAVPSKTSPAPMAVTPAEAAAVGEPPQDIRAQKKAAPTLAAPGESETASSDQQRSSLTADPSSREGGAERRPRRFSFGGDRNAAPRRAAGSSRKDVRGKEGWTGKAPGRVALMSGVFAGALATGLALSAINPDFAGRFFAGVSGQFGELLPKTTLIDAIAQGDLRTVRARLAEGVDPNTTDPEGNPALLRAARAGNLAAVSLLLQAGADPTLPAKDGRSVLHRAAAEGRSQALQRMLDAGAPVDLAGGVYGCLTPLAVAAANGRVRAAALLAERGASFDPQNGCSVGPMEIAAGHGHVLARLEQIRAERDAILQAARTSSGESQRRRGTTLLTADLSAGHAPGLAGLDEEPPALEPPLPETGDAAETLSEAVRGLPEDAAPKVTSEADEPTDPVQVAAADPNVFMPPPKPTPPPALDPRVFQSRLKTAIDTGNTGTVVALLGNPPPDFTLDKAKFAVEDRFGSGVRTALEQAALHGEDQIVRLLADKGASIPPSLVHRVVQHADEPELAGMLGILLEEGADPDGMDDGLTPLMRAALRGDPQTAYMLMAFGADPGRVSADGRLAADFAREAGRADLEERLVLASSEPMYRDLMMGLSWSDNLASLRDRIEVCKDIGDDFTACKLRMDSWLDDAKVIVAQFDRKASDRLVAIQIDSRPIGDTDSAIAQFETARRAIQSRIPPGHAGFVTTEVPSRETMFRDLRPEVNRGRYFSYWPDQDRRRPVFVHLKLAGLNDQQAFYRVVIGNPFRAS